MSIRQALGDCLRRASLGPVDPSRLTFEPTPISIQKKGICRKTVTTLTCSSICSSSGTTTMRYCTST
eukprot:2955402-Prymnesium_polylepis.1